MLLSVLPIEVILLYPNFWRQRLLQLLMSGRQVVAAARTSEKSEIFSDLLKQYRGQLIVEAGIDITDLATVKKEFWQGVTQIALCVGPVFGRQENGEMG